MKLSNFKIKLLRTFTAAFAVASFWSCSDKVDSSNLFVFEGETVANYLEDTEGYSMFSQLTKRVKTGRKTDSRVYSSQHEETTQFLPRATKPFSSS